MNAGRPLLASDLRGARDSSVRTGDNGPWPRLWYGDSPRLRGSCRVRPPRARPVTAEAKAVPLGPATSPMLGGVSHVRTSSGHTSPDRRAESPSSHVYHWVTSPAEPG